MVGEQTDEKGSEEKRNEQESELIDLSKQQEYFIRHQEVSENQLKTTIILRPSIEISNGKKRRGKLQFPASNIELIADCPDLNKKGSLKIIAELKESKLINRYLVYRKEYTDVGRLRIDYNRLREQIRETYFFKRPLKVRLIQI